jgi:hypothetical protein
VRPFYLEFSNALPNLLFDQDLLRNGLSGRRRVTAPTAVILSVLQDAMSKARAFPYLEKELMPGMLRGTGVLFACCR